MYPPPLYTGYVNQSNPQKKTCNFCNNWSSCPRARKKFLALIPPHSPLPPQKLVESQVAVLLCCLCGLDNTDTNWSMRNKQCCSSYKHLTHREALQNTMRKVDIKQVFIFISRQRFCPAHCYLSDESLSFHSLSLLWFFMYNIYKMSYFYKISQRRIL